jgi:hypothetical protein
MNPFSEFCKGVRVQAAVNYSTNGVGQSFCYSSDIDPPADYRYLRIRYNEIRSVILCA